MAKTHYLRLIIRGRDDDLIFEVRKPETERLQSVLSAEGHYAEPRFFWFDSVNGDSVVINLNEVQAIRLLWEPVSAPPDSTVNRGSIRIQLAGRRAYLEENTESLDKLYDLFANLENGPELMPFPAFPDEDGEWLFLNAAEVVWIVAPKHIVDEGARIVRAEL